MKNFKNLLALMAILGGITTNIHSISQAPSEIDPNDFGFIDEPEAAPVEAKPVTRQRATTPAPTRPTRTTKPAEPTYQPAAYNEAIFVDFASSNQPNTPIIFSNRECVKQDIWKFGWQKLLTCKGKDLEELRSYIGFSGQVIFKVYLTTVQKGSHTTGYNATPFGTYNHNGNTTFGLAGGFNSSSSYQTATTKKIAVLLKRDLNNPQFVTLTIDGILGESFHVNHLSFVLDQSDLNLLNTTMQQEIVVVNKSLKANSVLGKDSMVRLNELHNKYLGLRALACFAIATPAVFGVLRLARAHHNILPQQCATAATCGAIAAGISCLV